VQLKKYEDIEEPYNRMQKSVDRIAVVLGLKREAARYRYGSHI
jgi:hypothetical protein